MALLSPLPSLSPDRSVARERSVGGTSARSGGNSPTEGVGSGDQSGVEEAKGSWRRESAARRGDAAREDRDETVEAGSDGSGADLKSQTSKELDEKGPRVDAGSRSSSGSLKPAPSNEVADPDHDERKPSGSPSRRSFLAIDNNNSSSGNSPLPLSGDEGRKSDGDSDSDSDRNTMAAQEARVRRMRARFLDMKSLLDGDESSRPPSPKAAGETSPQKELGYGLAAAVADDDDGVSSSPVKGILVALGREHLSSLAITAVDRQRAILLFG